MLDVSRDRVPTRDTLEWLVGVLAGAGFNELQLYVEHAFAYTGHESVWADASPLTHDDMRWLDERAEANGIMLVANMNGFGHMGRWLEHEPYRHQAECPDGFTGLFGGGRNPPTCLEPTEANAVFAVELARDIASTVRATRIHIGGDEPFELGDGRSAARVAAQGRDHVHLEHLSRIIEPLVADGHEVMFWADLFRRDPTLIPKIPDGSVPVVWTYEAPCGQSWTNFLEPDFLERLGMPDDADRGFVAHARLFTAAEVPFWVAPGTASWNTIIGRNLNAKGNIADAVAVGAANSAPGLLLTDWGDGGHWQPLAVSLPSIVRAGAAATDGVVPRDAFVRRMVDELAAVPAGTGRVLDRLGEIGEGLGVTMPNGSPLCGALVDSRFPMFGDIDEGGVASAADVLVEATAWFAMDGFSGRGEVIGQEMRAACALASLGLRRLAADHGIEEAASALPAADVDDLVGQQRAAWLRSSRPGGLDDSIAGLRR